MKNPRTLFILSALMLSLLIGVNNSNAATLAATLKGRILLQVEQNGEAWYVNPVNELRYYLGRPDDAFNIMRELGLGISNKDFDSFNGYAPSRLSGRILLKVADSGKAYYVNTNDLKMYYLGRPADAFNVMRELGLGITDKNLGLISIADNETANWQTYKDVKNGFELKYPAGMNIAEALTVNVTSESEIRGDIANRIKNDQCPGSTCPDNKSLSDNFGILSKAGTCPYTESFKNEVKNSYQLFSGAINHIGIVDGIINNNLKICILKTVGTDGYDVNLDNIYYRSAFLYNGKIVTVSFLVFQRRIFAETDAYLAQAGFNFKDNSSDGSCDIACTEKEGEIFRNYLNDSLAKKNIETYDKILSTFKFTN